MTDIMTKIGSFYAYTGVIRPTVVTQTLRYPFLIPCVVLRPRLDYHSARRYDMCRFSIMTDKPYRIKMLNRFFMTDIMTLSTHATGRGYSGSDELDPWLDRVCSLVPYKSAPRNFAYAGSPSLALFQVSSFPLLHVEESLEVI
jgi:hypothetical protein